MTSLCVPAVSKVIKVHVLLAYLVHRAVLVNYSPTNLWLASDQKTELQNLVWVMGELLLEKLRHMTALVSFPDCSM